jgi:hypothetical protein
MSRVFEKKGVFVLSALSWLQLLQSVLSKLDSFAKGVLCSGSVLYTVFYGNCSMFIAATAVISTAVTAAQTVGTKFTNMHTGMRY